MKTRWIALAAIALWGVTIVVLAVMFMRGQTAPSTDGRSAVQLAPAERDLLLTDMRGMLRSVQGIVQALAQGDSGKAAEAARASGMAAMSRVPPMMMAKLPMPFRQMGSSVHQGFDRLATDAEAGAPPARLTGALEAQLGICVACHEAYRLP